MLRSGVVPLIRGKLMLFDKGFFFEDRKGVPVTVSLHEDVTEISLCEDEQVPAASVPLCVWMVWHLNWHLFCLSKLCRMTFCLSTSNWSPQMRTGFWSCWKVEMMPQWSYVSQETAGNASFEPCCLSGGPLGRVMLFQEVHCRFLSICRSSPT